MTGRYGLNIFENFDDDSTNEIPRLVVVLLSEWLCSHLQLIPVATCL